VSRHERLRRPHLYFEGEHQRVRSRRLHDRPGLLLDEPAAGLDVRPRDLVRLGEIAADDRPPTVLVTHHLENRSGSPTRCSCAGEWCRTDRRVLTPFRQRDVGLALVDRRGDRWAARAPRMSGDVRSADPWCGG
jgi:hypothetical protein